MVIDVNNLLLVDITGPTGLMEVINGEEIIQIVTEQSAGRCVRRYRGVFRCGPCYHQDLGSGVHIDDGDRTDSIHSSSNRYPGGKNQSVIREITVKAARTARARKVIIK